MQLKYKYILIVISLVPSIATAAKPSQGDLNKVNAEIAWLHTLHTFRHAPVSIAAPGNSFGTPIMRLAGQGQYSNVVVTVSDSSDEFVVDLYVKHMWTDEDTILLQSIAKHLTGEPGRPITPEMAINAIQAAQDGNSIVEYLPNSKLQFDYVEERFGECPWKDNCYIADIRVTPP